MKNPKLANRYAKALFEYAGEQSQIETVNQDLTIVSNALQGNRELLTVLNSPVIVPAKKHILFKAIFKEHISELTFTFLDVIIKKKREPILSSICEEYIKYYNDYHHIKIVTLTTAQPLSPALTEQIRTMIAEQTQHTIEIKQIVNPDIIGGIMIKMGDYIFDASILAKINKLKNEFAHNIYQVNY